jgi:hypothetical protein
MVLFVVQIHWIPPLAGLTAENVPGCFQEVLVCRHDLVRRQAGPYVFKGDMS